MVKGGASARPPLSPQRHPRAVISTPSSPRRSVKRCGSGGGDLSKPQLNFTAAILLRRAAFRLQAWTGPRPPPSRGQALPRRHGGAMLRMDIAGAGMTEESARVISRLTRSRKPRSLSASSSPRRYLHTVIPAPQREALRIRRRGPVQASVEFHGGDLAQACSVSLAGLDGSPPFLPR